MTANTTPSNYLDRILKMAVAGATGAIEGLPADEEVFIPSMILEKDGKFELSIVMQNTNAEAVRVARVIVQQQAQEINSYVIYYFVRQQRSDGAGGSAIMLEAGAKGMPFNYRFVQPFVRGKDKKVQLLTDKLLLIEKSAALI